MQAAALGVYLLYGPSGDFLIDAGGGSLTGESSPSSVAEWRVDGSATQGFTITDLATGTQLPVNFVPATGCATFPEAGVDATGTPFTGASPEANVLGTVEGHAHVTAFELFGGDWHCGKPWSPFGVTAALPASCAPEEQGTNGEFEALLDYGGATRPSDMHGWPTFVDWPSPTAVAEEGDYYTGIERAWKAGLRVMVTNLVDNEALCSLMTTTHLPCNDMSSVRTQSADLYALQNYIDAQSGGPGKGWFRIVTDPFQARKVINQGKLAVIEGIEVSRIFGCGEVNNVPQCNESQIDAGLKEIHDLGVRTFFPVHEFDNAFGGTKMIAGDIGTVINVGNKDETGNFWNIQPCPAQDQDAEQLSAPAAGSGALGQLVNGPLASMLGGSQVPVYGSGPGCNTRGLTSLGAYVISQMIKQHFLIQLDHMDSKTATAALAIAQAAHYSGVISAHCCNSPQLFGGVYATGGFISPPAEPAAAFVATWKADKALSSPKYHFGIGYGSDMNGLAEQPGPSSGTPITYPFKSYDGKVTFTQEQWGQRTFNLNTDGRRQLRHVRRLAAGPAGRRRPADDGRHVPGRRGLPRHLGARRRRSEHELPAGPRELHRARTRQSDPPGRHEPGGALSAPGQPTSRPGRSYRYCVTGSAASKTPVTSVFNARGRVVAIASTAHGDRAGAIAPGASARRVSRTMRRVSAGLWVGPQAQGRGLLCLWNAQRAGPVRRGRDGRRGPQPEAAAV